jgi:hypothetical protein
LKDVTPQCIDTAEMCAPDADEEIVGGADGNLSRTKTLFENHTCLSVWHVFLTERHAKYNAPSTSIGMQ